MSFKHWLSVRTLPPLVTPFLFSTAMVQTWVGEESFYLQCLASSKAGAPFSSLYQAPEKGFPVSDLGSMALQCVQVAIQKSHNYHLKRCKPQTNLCIDSEGIWGEFYTNEGSAPNSLAKT